MTGNGSHIPRIKMVIFLEDGADDMVLFTLLLYINTWFPIYQLPSGYWTYPWKITMLLRTVNHLFRLGPWLNHGYVTNNQRVVNLKIPWTHGGSTQGARPSWWLPHPSHPIAQCPGTHGGLELRLGEVGDQRWALTRGGLGGPAAAGRSHGWPPHGWVDFMENPIYKWMIKFGG